MGLHTNHGFVDNNNLLHDLKTLLAGGTSAGTLQLATQPIVSTRNMLPAGVEALSRWHHPQHGTIPASVFVPLLEIAGLAPIFDVHMLQQGLKLEPQIPESYRLWFNISAATLQENPDPILTLIKAFPLGRVGVELTETYPIVDRDIIKTSLEQLRHQGVMVALDDFGTGWGSLRNLTELPFDVLKIDRETLLWADHNNDQRIITALVDLADTFNASVTIEGVETSNQSQLALMSGCTFMQGFYIAKPTLAPPLTPQPALATT